MTCAICNGPLMLLGILGRLAHLLCRNCGHPACVEASELEGEE